MSLSTQLSTLPSSSTHAVPERDRASRAERTRQIVCQLANCHDEDERLDLTNELAAVNMPVADSVVTRYRARGIATEDLKQVAYLALTKAARRFDPCAGHDFLSFCVPTIRGEIRRYFRDKGWMVRPPRRIQELQQRLTGAQADLTTGLGRPPNVDELARHLDEDPADVREALDGQGCFSPTSLDRPVGEEQGASLGELIGIEDDRPLSRGGTRRAGAPRTSTERSRPPHP